MTTAHQRIDARNQTSIPITTQMTTMSALHRGRTTPHITRTMPVSAVCMYDWRISRTYNRPVLTGQHNAFPRRVPSAASDKLRQMYMKTDTISGRLAFNSAHERSQQKRWSAFHQAIEHQERELEERNRDMVNLSERQSEHSAAAAQSAPPTVVNAIRPRKHHQTVIPPISSWRGITIIKERRRRLTSEAQHVYQPEPDVTSHTPGGQKMSAEMRIYLPRADLVEEVIDPSSDYGHSSTPRLRYTNSACGNMDKQTGECTDISSRDNDESESDYLRKPMSSRW